MAKIKKIDRKTLKTFRTDFNKAVEAFAKKNGVVMSIEGIRFSDSEFTGKLKVIIAPTGNMSAEEAMGRKSLDLEGVFFGLKENDYGRTFKNWDGDTYKLTGVKSSRPKYPVSATNVRTGKSFKFGEDVIAKLSKRKTK